MEKSIDTDTKRMKINFPYRKLDLLFASRETLNCAVNSRCVPCAYKIACFDVALDNEFTSVVPNQRPEQCPRSHIDKNLMHNKKNSQMRFDSKEKVYRGFHGYYHGMNVLTVGDGDFSFSLALARILCPTKLKYNKGCIIVSSYESFSTLESIYPNINDTISELRSLGAKVLFELDATRIQEHSYIQTHLSSTKTETSNHLFHRIIWNFPCTAEPNGQDGQNTEMDQNKQMVHQFLICATKYLLHPISGEIHMAHKTKPPYDQWELEHMASNLSSSSSSSIDYLGRIVLDRYCFKPYIPRKALDRKSFPNHDACIFIFGTKSKVMPSMSIHSKIDHFPSTLPIIQNSANVDTYLNDETCDIVPVTMGQLLELRSLHLFQKKLSKKRKKSFKKIKMQFCSKKQRISKK